MNEEQGTLNKEFRSQRPQASPFIIPCSLFDIPPGQAPATREFNMGVLQT
jgi:hypothetical protein